MKKKYTLVVMLFGAALAFGQPTNDDCANAELITVSQTNTNFTFDINTAALNNETICTTTNDYADVWYEFIMPFNGNLFVDGTLAWNNFALYSSCGGAEIDCGNSNKLFTSLVSGTTYFLKVYRTSSTAANTNYQSFDIKAFQSVANDDCNSSENITVSTTTSTINFEIGGASVINEVGCSGSAEDYVDIWYDFTMPVNGNLYIEGAIAWNNIALYDACGGTLIQCGSTNEFISGLNSGSDYKLRVFRTKSQADNSYLSFAITAYEAVNNDDCNTSENITVTTTASTIDFEIGGASINNEVGCNGTAAADYVDIWYDFIMPVDGNLYVDGSLAWNAFALYNSCGGTEIQCGASNQFIENLTSGTSYKLRVFRTLALADNEAYKEFTIQAFENVTNDDCTSAENISVTTTASTVNFEIGGASINNEIGCSGTTAEDYVDIWYDFTMPVNGNLNVNGSLTWNNFALYDACNGTEIQCGSSSQLFTDLTATTNYKLRVFRNLALADNDAYRAFTIQAFEIINNDDCASSETIVVSDILTTVNFGIAGAAINNEVGCSGTTAEDYADIWYDITMPTDGSISIDGDVSWNNFALYDACGGNELGCFDASGDFAGLTNGTSYKLRLFRTLALASNDAYKSFTIQSNATLTTNTNALEDSMSIYPNPADTALNILITDNQSIDSIELYTIRGKKIVSTTAKTINVSNFESGIYILKISTKNGQVTKRIIIQ